MTFQGRGWKKKHKDKPQNLDNHYNATTEKPFRAYSSVAMDDYQT